MPVKRIPLNELQKQILNKITLGERLFSYWTPEDFVYVTRFNETLVIHYKMIFTKGDLVIEYALTGQKDPLPFKPEKRQILLVSMPKFEVDETKKMGLSCNHSCSPSDWCKGGKCDLNGCYHE